MKTENSKFKIRHLKWRALALYLIPCTLFLFASCEKEELPIKPHDKGDIITPIGPVDSADTHTVRTVQIGMGSNYTDQVWYDLGTNKVVATNSRFDWDIAFDCRASEHWVYLNSALAMMAAPTGNTDFNAPIEEKKLHFRPDHPSGLEDSLALGRWWDEGQVWVIDLGYELDGSSRGKRKIKFETTSTGDLKFRYASLNGSNEVTGTIAKDDRYNRIMFSFKDNTVKQIEPPKTDYDLMFSQYMHVFYDPYYPYLVTGALLNPYATEAVRVNESDFGTITRETVNLYDLSDEADIIGYEWKYFDLEGDYYTVYPEMNYIVRDSEGIHYKLHFVDFYNKTGEKGYPKMEVQRL